MSIKEFHLSRWSNLWIIIIMCYFKATIWMSLNPKKKKKSFFLSRWSVVWPNLFIYFDWKMVEFSTWFFFHPFIYFSPFFRHWPLNEEINYYPVRLQGRSLPRNQQKKKKNYDRVWWETGCFEFFFIFPHKKKIYSCCCLC